MSAPYVIERQIGERTWYIVCAEFATAYMAKQTWENVERRRKGGSVGLYRHGPEQEGGRLLTAVTMDADEARRMASMLRVGTHYELDEDTIMGLIARRARVVTDALRAGQSRGRLMWRRPEGRGARLDPRTGEMIEHEPGQG